MGRTKRNPENEGLPRRWKHEHGAYYYQVPAKIKHLWGGKAKFLLGHTLAEAYKVWSDRLQSQLNIRRVSELLDRYLLEVTPTKALRTQADEPGYVARLKPVFGH